MGPQRCAGFDDNGCIVKCAYNPEVKGAKAIAKRDGRCMVCSPSLMAEMCSTVHKRCILIYHLKRIRTLDAQLFQEAIRRTPAEWQQTVEETAARSKPNTIAKQNVKPSGDSSRKKPRPAPNAKTGPKAKTKAKAHAKSKEAHKSETKAG